LRIPVGPDLGGDTLLVDIAGRCFLTSAGGVLCLAEPGLRRAAGPGTFVTLEAGGDHDCGLTAGGTARCWGENYAGQLGTGDFAFSDNPVTVSGGHRFIDLALGASHTCGLTDERVVLCWGEPAVGQAGVSILTDNLTVPTRVRGQGTP